MCTTQKGAIVCWSAMKGRQGLDQCVYSINAHRLAVVNVIHKNEFYAALVTQHLVDALRWPQRGQPGMKRP